MSNEVKLVRDTMIKPVAIAAQIVCIVLIGALVWQAAVGAAITLVATWLLFDMMDHADLFNRNPIERENLTMVFNLWEGDH